MGLAMPVLPAMVGSSLTLLPMAVRMLVIHWSCPGGVPLQGAGAGGAVVGIQGCWPQASVIDAELRENAGQADKAARRCG